MLVSFNWLKEYVDITISAQELGERLTAAGIIVDNVIDINNPLEHCVVGRLKQVVRHTNSDHLWICQVDVGQEILQIITGAQNVRAGQLVPVAMVGAKLPNGLKIKKSKLRGEVSNGMLISLEELGYDAKVMSPAEREGIYIIPEGEAQVGQAVAEVLGHNDYLLDLDLTPNRADCSSILGLAIEVAAILEVEMKNPQYYQDNPHAGNEIENKVSVQIKDKDLCSLYALRMFEDITIKPSPLWMQNRLRHAGMRPINNLVDITNYVMLEIGQPLHAFDYEQIAGAQIKVRRASAGESIETLDSVNRKLTSEMLVIADAEKPVAIAGVMGGLQSEVTPQTKTILLESANFFYTSVRRTSRALGLSSEAAIRFSKGIEQAKVHLALDRCAYLLCELNAGSVIPGVVKDQCSFETPRTIRLRPDYVNTVIGTQIPSSAMHTIMQRLGFESKLQANMLEVTVPTRRPDITTEIDLVEEVARLWGYDQITAAKPHVSENGRMDRSIELRRRSQDILRALGVNEVINYAFHDPLDLDELKLPEDDPLRRTVKIFNPLTEKQSVMRTSLIPGLLQTARYNLNRQQKGIIFSEIGTVFSSRGANQLPLEKMHLGIIAAGVSEDKTWYQPKVVEYDFFAVKGIIEALCESYHLQVSFKRSQRPYLHPGRTAAVTLDDREIGYIGEIHPDISPELRIIVAELDHNALLEHAERIPSFEEITPYPAVTRDLAVIVDRSIPVGSLIAYSQKVAGELLEEIRLFDVYAGKQIDAHKYSCAFALRYRAVDRTLTDQEVNDVHQSLIKALQQEFGAVLR